METIVIVLKGICLTYIPFGTSIAAGLGELEVEEILGLPISAVKLFFAATVAGAGGLLAFLSRSFANYAVEAKQASNGKTPQNPSLGTAGS